MKKRKSPTDRERLDWLIAKYGSAISPAAGRRKIDAAMRAGREKNGK